MCITNCSSRKYFNFIADNCANLFHGTTTDQKVSSVADRTFSALKLLISPAVLLVGCSIWICEQAFKACQQTKNSSVSSPVVLAPAKKAISQDASDESFIGFVQRLWNFEKECYEYAKMQDEAFAPARTKNEYIDVVHGFRKIFAIADSDLALKVKAERIKTILRDNSLPYPEVSTPIDVTDSSTHSGAFTFHHERYLFRELYIERRQIAPLKELASLRPITIRELFVRTNAPKKLPETILGLKKISNEFYSDVKDHVLSRLASPISGKQCVRYQAA